MWLCDSDDDNEDKDDDDEVNDDDEDNDDDDDDNDDDDDDVNDDNEGVRRVAGMARIWCRLETGPGPSVAKTLIAERPIGDTLYLKV